MELHGVSTQVPVLRYNMETLTERGLMKDLSGNGNHGTIVGTSAAIGQIGLARHFNGIPLPDEFIEVPDSPSLRITSSFTLAAWIRPERISTEGGTIFSKRSGSTGYSLALLEDNVLGLSIGIGSLHGSASIPTDGTWTHVAIAFDDTANAVRFYVNGQADGLAQSYPGAVGDNPFPLFIGTSETGLGEFDGGIDESRIYRRGLSADEIRELYASDLPPDTDLSFEWDFGDGSERASSPAKEHAYARSGTYLVSLTVTDSRSAIDIDRLVVRVLNKQPRAALALPANVVEDQRFEASSAGTVDTPTDRASLRYLWTWGDGSTSTAQHPTHAYHRAGTYTVTLTVTDDDGAPASAAGEVRVVNTPPVAGIEGPDAIVEGSTAAFDARGSTDTPTDLADLGFTWDFNRDGIPDAFGPRATHVRSDDANYTVRVEVTDDDHVRGSSELVVVVANAAPEVSIVNASVVPKRPGRPSLSWTVVLEGWIYDPGSDGITGSWDFGDGTVQEFAFPSDGTFPRRLAVAAIHTFPFGTFVVRLIGGDDDGGFGEDAVAAVSSKPGFSIDNLAPAATAGGELTAVEDEPATFTAKVADAESGTVTSITWDFGDGSQAQGASVTHSYAVAGTYLATVTVMDSASEASVDSVRVVVLNRAPLAVVTAPLEAVEDELVRFDGVGTEDTPSDRAQLQFHWSFSDGSEATGPSVERSFPVGGSSAYELRVEDDNGAVSVAGGAIEIRNLPPRAVLLDDLSPVEDIAFAFDAAASSDTPTDLATLRFEWQFGDGATATGLHSVHRYSAAGLYPLRLDVVDPDGSRDFVSVPVSVGDPPPIAHVAPSELLVFGRSAEFTFEGFGFDTPADQSLLEFLWDFGDGTSGVGPRVVHQFGAFGSFSVTLTVTDDTGRESSDTVVVSVVLDSDIDGLPDRYEAAVSGTDPMNGDTDGDNLLDFFEAFSGDIFGAATDPFVADKDSDRLTDWEEVFGTRGYVTNPSVSDTDGDRLDDGEEVTLGVDLTVTNPTLADTDGDGLQDWDEFFVYNSNATRPDTDGDSIRDDVEVTNRTLALTIDGVSVVRTILTAPNTNDTDLDGLLDPEEIAGTSVYGAITDPTEQDTDQDGLADGQERYVRISQTGKRYPIRDDGRLTETEDLAVQPSWPASEVEGAQLMVGLTHPDMGQLRVDLLRTTGMPFLVILRNRAGAGQVNNFTNFDLLRSFGKGDFAVPSKWRLLAQDGVSGEVGQIEYAQIHVTVRTSPVRSDTDGDGLNDSEEVTLGADGFLTDPWNADTDGDSIDDNVETGGWSWSGPSIVPSPPGFHTDPARKDTDRDGVSDGRDRVPLGNAFVQVSLHAARVLGSDPHNPDGPLPFAMASLQGNTTFTLYKPLFNGWANWTTTPSGTRREFQGHYLAVDVPDDTATVDISVQMWSFDSRGHNEHTPIAIQHGFDRDGPCFNVAGPATLTYALQAPYTSRGFNFTGCGGTDTLNADPFTIVVTTIIPFRVGTTLVVPADYSGVYNVTDANGSVVARRYTGEPRFVAFLLNVESVFGIMDPEAILVPRSLFFSTRLHGHLSAADPVAPLNKLAFRQNDTAATTNSDDLHAILSGNVTLNDFLTIVDMLTTNESGGTIGRPIIFSINDEVAGNPLFFSLPDGVVRLIG